MNDPLDRYMTVGLLEPAAFPFASSSSASTLFALRQVGADDFFGAVETSIEAAHAAGGFLSGSNLIVDVDAGSALYASGASLCSLDPCQRQHALQISRAAVDAAYAVGAQRVSLTSGRDPGALHRPAAFQALVDSILAVYEYTRASGALELSLKMADRAVDKCFLIGPTADGVALAQQVRTRYPAFGLVLNLAHLPLLGEDPAAAVHLAAPYLARVHIGNCIVGQGDHHPRFGVPNGAIGVGELSGFLRALLAVGYLSAESRNVIAFEVRPLPDEDPMQVIADSKRVLCQAWALV